MAFDAVRSGASIIHAFPFNSEKKRGGVAVQLVRRLQDLEFWIWEKSVVYVQSHFSLDSGNSVY